MHFHIYPMLTLLAIFAFVLSVLVGVHWIANDALVVLLPGDGCGQILNSQLQFQIKSVLALAYATSCLAAFSFAVSVTFDRGTVVFFVSATGCMVAFLVAGATHLRYSEHLNSCDTFFLGRDAPYLNFGAVGLMVLLVALALYKAQAKQSL